MNIIHQHSIKNTSNVHGYCTIWDSKFNSVSHKWEGYYYNIINYTCYDNEEYRMKYLNDNLVELIHKTINRERCNEIELMYNL